MPPPPPAATTVSAAPRRPPRRAAGRPPERTLLLIGPLPIAGDQVGGAKVAFRQMVADLGREAGLGVRVVNLSRPLLGRGALGRALAGARAGAAVATALLRHGRAHAVWALNCSSGGTVTLFPIVFALAALARRPLVLRVFGGNLDERHAASGRLGRLAFGAMARRCRAVVLETEALAARYRPLGNVRRLPNARSLPPPSPPRERCTRLIFLGRIAVPKGLDVLLEAMAGLEGRCTLDCHGSPADPALVARLRRAPGTAYHGELDPGRVGDALGAHDALVLPTFWDGEGLPGVVVEAFQSGRPVVASRWRRIPELVRHGENGLLVEPGSAEALRAALRELAEDAALYARLCAGARASGEAYRSDVWHARFVEWCFA